MTEFREACPLCGHDADHLDARDGCAVCNDAAGVGQYAPCQAVPVRHQRPVLTTPERAFLIQSRAILATIEREHPGSAMATDAAAARRSIGRLLPPAELYTGRLTVTEPRAVDVAPPGPLELRAMDGDR